MEYLQYISELKFILETLCTNQIFAKAVASFDRHIVLSFVIWGKYSTVRVSHWKIKDVNFYIDICTAEIYELENLGVNNGTLQCYVYLYCTCVYNIDLNC